MRRGLTADILAIFLRKGYRLLGLKLMRISRELAERHYAEHQGKAFFEPLLAFMTGGPVVAMVLAGTDAIATVRTLMGATDPAKAQPGTIRSMFATAVTENVVHGSASPEDAEREIALFFAPGELLAGPA